MEQFPELAVAGSPINAAFVARYKAYQGTNYFNSPDWPMRLAKECAAGISGTNGVSLAQRLANTTWNDANKEDSRGNQKSFTLNPDMTARASWRHKELGSWKLLDDSRIELQIDRNTSITHALTFNKDLTEATDENGSSYNRLSPPVSQSIAQEQAPQASAAPTPSALVPGLLGGQRLDAPLPELPLPGTLIQKVTFRSNANVNDIRTLKNQIVVSTDGGHLDFVDLSGSEQNLDAKWQLVNLEWDRKKPLPQDDLKLLNVLGKILADGPAVIKIWDQNMVTASGTALEVFDWDSKWGSYLQRIRDVQTLRFSTPFTIVQKIADDTYEAVGQSGMHFVLKTKEIDFQSEGRASLPIEHTGDIEVSLKDGFTKKLLLYQEVDQENLDDTIKELREQGYELAAELPRKRFSRSALESYIEDVRKTTEASQQKEPGYYRFWQSRDNDFIFRALILEIFKDYFR